MMRLTLLVLINICLSLCASELIVIRHGEATHNVQDIYSSNASSEAYIPSYLTEKGRQSACETAHLLEKRGFCDANIQAVYVSPLPRTRQTAEILVKCGLFSRDKIRIDERLREVDPGDLEGKKVIHAWKESYVELYHTESKEHIEARVKDFLDTLPPRAPWQNVIVITHGIPASILVQLGTGCTQKVQHAQFVIFPF